MKVLIVKTSSLGDIIHTLPALTDARFAIPEIQFDWVIEEAFQEIPHWHPAVDRVIPVGLRRWRKNWLRSLAQGQIKNFKQQLKQRDYDLIIDAQGLLKSGWIAKQAKGKRVGLDRHSAKEGIVAYSYHQRYAVDRGQHAISRVRELFAKALAYPLPTATADAAIDIEAPRLEKNLVFLHATTWQSKHWPDEYWLSLAKMATQQGFKVQLPWNDEQEKNRADWIASQVSGVDRLDKLNLTELAHILKSAQGVVGVDTGLMHLAAALDKPAVSLFGATNSVLTGAIGLRQFNLQAQMDCSPCMQKQCRWLNAQQQIEPCYQQLDPQMVFLHLLRQLGANDE